jgi:hypothetical protein
MPRYIFFQSFIIKTFSYYNGAIYFRLKFIRSVWSPATIIKTFVFLSWVHFLIPIIGSLESFLALLKFVYWCWCLCTGSTGYSGICCVILFLCILYVFRKVIEINPLCDVSFSIETVVTEHTRRLNNFGVLRIVKF